MKQISIQKIILSAVFCALVFAATWVSIPAPLVGNINLGDGVLLVGAWILGCPWAVFACTAGAVLCDLVGGYALYAPATLIIKALMVVVAVYIPKAFEKLHLHARIARILGAIAAEFLMILGYFTYEALALGYGLGAIANIPFNAIQSGLAVVVSTLVYTIVRACRPLRK